jgi:hypothetical protein
LETFAKDQDANQPAPLVYAIPAKKRRWPAYVFILLALGTAGKIIEQIQTSTPMAVNPTPQASPSPAATPSPQQAKHHRAQSQKAVSTLNSAPVIISQSPQNASNTISSAVESSAPGSFGRRSSSGRSYILGPRGGCYYLSGSGGKVYVDHTYCH